MALFDGLVGPVVVGEPQLVETSRIVDRRVDVGTPRLEQQHLDAAIDEPASGGRAGGPGADDDHVGPEVVDVAVCNSRGDWGLGHVISPGRVMSSWHWSPGRCR